MLELLTVITIIAILISIVVGAGLGTLRNQRRAATLSALRALDGALEEFLAETGVVPRYDPRAYARRPGLDVEIDSMGRGDRENTEQAFDSPNDIAFTEYLGRTHPRRPDASVFLSQAIGYGEVEQIVQNAPSRFFVVTLPDPSENPCTSPSSPEDLVDCDPTPSVVDAWADPMWSQYRGGGTEPFYPLARQSLVYYVHPGNRLARELYGQTSSGRPYFLSPGPDGLYGLPEEFVFTGDAVRPVRGEGRTLRKASGESEEEFKQRALREARKDNVTSYPIDASFNLSTDLLNLGPNAWRSSP